MRSIAILLLAIVSVALTADLAAGARLAGNATLDAAVLLMCLVLLGYYLVWPKLRGRRLSGAAIAAEFAEDDDLVTTPATESSAVDREVEKEERR
jgi:hypothetical protein